jgi:hypothetical protein
MNYHDRPEVSYSQLKVLKDSPREFEAKYITRTMEQETTDAMDKGTAVHLVLLEPEKAASELVCIPSEVLASNGAKIGGKWKEFEAEHQGKTLLKVDDYDKVMWAANAVRQHAIGRQFIELKRQTEVEILWQRNDIALRSKLDLVSGPYVVDLKTTAKLREDDFAKSVARFHYPLQGAMYLQAAQQHYERDFYFAWLCVETEAPYRVRVYQLTEEAKQLGQTMFDKLLEEYADRLARGDWSEPNESNIIDVPMPSWYVTQELLSV